MHEKILQGVTVGVVAGLMVYWLTSKQRFAFSSAPANAYSPLLGDVRALPHGTGTSADCQCCGLVPPQSTPSPLAADYLDTSVQHAPVISCVNVGVQPDDPALYSSIVHYDEMASTFPHGMAGQDTTPPRGVLVKKITCHPDVPAQLCCMEVI